MLLRCQILLSLNPPMAAILLQVKALPWPPALASSVIILPFALFNPAQDPAPNPSPQLLLKHVGPATTHIFLTCCYPLPISAPVPGVPVAGLPPPSRLLSSLTGATFPCTSSNTAPATTSSPDLSSLFYFLYSTQHLLTSYLFVFDHISPPDYQLLENRTFVWGVHC